MSKKEQSFIPGLGLGKIISASRRTDIPSFYSRWFIERLRAGYVLVRNPFNYSQIRKVSLLPQDVSAIVFWTRDATPLIPFFDEIESKLIPFSFLWTITAYPKELEPNGVGLERGIETFIQVAERVGKNRMAVRYDPIIISKKFTPEWHFKVFSKIVRKLKNYTSRIIISILTPYPTVMSRLKRIDETIVTNPLDRDDVRELLVGMSKIAKQNDIPISACSMGGAMKEMGIEDAPCIDPVWLSNGLGIKVKYKKDKGQRHNCLCTESIDIGSYDTCPRMCMYCYAFKSRRRVLRNFLKHDVSSDILT